MNSTDYIKFAIDNLKNDTRFKDVDMSESSAFYNLNILPFALLLKPVYDLNINTLNAMVLDSMNSEQLDNFANTLFIKRQLSDVTTLEVTLYFDNPTSAVEPCIITTNDEFRTSGNQVYNPVQDVVISISSLPLQTVNSATYRVATIMTQSRNNHFLVLPDSIKTTSIVHPSLISVTNLVKSSIPPSTQTDESFKTDIKNAIGLRSSTTLSAIYTNVKQNFPDVIDCLPIGYGDPEMQRDIAVAAKTWSGHFGGMTDILIRTSLVPASFTTTGQPTVAKDGIVFTLRKYKGYDWYANDNATPNSNQLMPWISLDTNPLPVMPLLFINWARTSITGTSIRLNSTGQPDYTIEVLPDPVEKSYGKNYRFSQYENLRITIKTTTPITSDTNVKLAYYTLSNIENVQSFISDSANRPACSNNLVKSFIPIEIKSLVVVYKPVHSFVKAVWQQTLADRINNYSSTSNFAFTELFTDFPNPINLSEAWKGTNNLPFVFDVVDGEITSLITALGNHPTYATMIQHNIDGSQKYYASTSKLYQLQTSNGLSATSRTCRYFILPENITFITES